MEDKDQIVEIIRSRIESEFRKHKDIDWVKIAAIKIYHTLKEIEFPSSPQ